MQLIIGLSGLKVSNNHLKVRTFIYEKSENNVFDDAELYVNSLIFCEPFTD